MKEITDLQREMLKKYHLDAMVTMTPENITYVTGAYIPTQVTVRSRKVIHIITEKHNPVVIVVNIEEPIMRAQSWMDPKSIISYNEFTQNPMMIAIDKLKEFGMETKRIGMELSYLSAIDMDLMHRELPHAEIVNADAAYEEMRFIKMQFELDRIISFGSNIEEVIYGAFASARAGMTEKDIYRFISNGFAEIAKSSFVAPRRSFFEWLRDNADGLVSHDTELLEEIVYMTAEFKASVVSADSTESAGVRECLNYGHTLAHAIENAAGYGTIAHGRAVAEGMRFAARLSVEVLGCDVSVVKATDVLLDRLGLPELPWVAPAERLFNLMKGDKKCRGGQIRFVLLEDIARWKLVSVPDDIIMEHLGAWCAAKRRLIEQNDGKMWGQA